MNIYPYVSVMMLTDADTPCPKIEKKCYLYCDPEHPQYVCAYILCYIKPILKFPWQFIHALPRNSAKS